MTSWASSLRQCAASPVPHRFEPWPYARGQGVKAGPTPDHVGTPHSACPSGTKIQSVSPSGRNFFRLFNSGEAQDEIGGLAGLAAGLEDELVSFSHGLSQLWQVAHDSGRFSAGDAEFDARKQIPFRRSTRPMA